MQLQWIVTSVGVNKYGQSVLRVKTPHNSTIEIATNVIGLSKLAQSGVPVDNDAAARTGKA